MPRGIIKSWNGEEGIILSGETEVSFYKGDLKQNVAIKEGDAVLFGYISRMFYPDDKTRATNIERVKS